MDIESILCPLCEKNVESSSHIFFTRKVLLWWEIDVVMVSSYDEWLEWLLSIRLHSKHKELFEGVCYVLWWYIWNFCNKSIFGSACPSKALIFEEIDHEVLNLDSKWTRAATVGKPGFTAALAVLVTGASQSRQHGNSEPDSYYLSD
ncbi:hypothetical protein Tco_1405373 [Tanacetum coccineum]